MSYIKGGDAVRVAMMCHEANRTFCIWLGDDSQVSWNAAPEWQKESAVAGVRFVYNNRNAPASANHDAWMADKIADGWVYGETKDADAKTHPCIVPYEELPREQQFKDALFRTTALSAFAAFGL